MYEIIDMQTKEVVAICNTLKECREYAKKHNCHSPGYYARKISVERKIEYMDCVDRSDISSIQ